MPLSTKVTLRLTYTQRTGGQLTITPDKSFKPQFSVTAFFNAGVKDFPDLNIEVPAAQNGELSFVDDKVPKGMTGFTIKFSKESKDATAPTQISLGFMTGKPMLDNVTAMINTSRPKADGPLDKLPLIDVLGYALWT